MSKEERGKRKIVRPNLPGKMANCAPMPRVHMAGNGKVGTLRDRNIIAGPVASLLGETEGEEMVEVRRGQVLNTMERTLPLTHLT